MRVREGAATPPMDLPALVAGSSVPDDVRAAVEAVLRRAGAALSAPGPLRTGGTRDHAWSLADDVFRRLVGGVPQPVG